ncbi:Leucine-rich repeat, immunoglobulin-like domain and transmembrane domain-containing protein 1 [Haplosporangium sp. Z 11]|nr:Leucine-rich repeat, immunoglobulin-like domain and transmembrane domain-containing protein 1 [Haplosporangium sp. Z 11]
MPASRPTKAVASKKIFTATRGNADPSDLKTTTTVTTTVVTTTVSKAAPTKSKIKTTTTSPNTKGYGEAGNVDMMANGPLFEAIADQLSSFEPRNVYNCDETGLHLKVLSNRTLSDKKVAGRKLVKVSRLTHLDLHDNQIQALPNKISQLSNLVVLQLCTNHLHLQHLSDEIGKLNKLQELKFENNPLRSLPKTIQRLPNARRVHQQGCEHRDLPVELGTAFELIYLDLSSSQFEVMPALNHMTKLEEFYISNNYLREIGASSLNLQSSNNSTNSYNSGTVSVGSGAGLISSVSTKHGSSSQGDLNAGTGTIQGGVTNSSVGQGVAAGTAMTGGGVTVLDLGYNLLAWLPKEVGDLADLKVLILEGNPIKSLQSSLVELVAYAVTYKLSDSFYVVEEQEQAPMNMKVNVLQSITPQQIERTSLMRIHDSILKRVQELDSQQYRDQHDPDNNNGSRSISRAITKTQLRVPGTTFALASSAMSTLQ